MFGSWKVWERGAPHVVVEIVSPFDDSERSWAKKLPKYHRLGASEVVRFHPESSELRIWDYVEGDLVERVLTRGEPAPCVPLGLFWVVAKTQLFRTAPDEPEAVLLRLARDPEGKDLLPTPEEAARDAALTERDAALERVRVLELELLKRR